MLGIYILYTVNPRDYVPQAPANGEKSLFFYTNYNLTLKEVAAIS